MSDPKIKTTINDGIPEMDVTEVNQYSEKIKLIDVRRPDEFNNELGHINGAKLITLGPDLEEFFETYLTQTQKNENQQVPLVLICRSGSRSGHATLLAMDMGIKNIYNMTGGMIRWNDFGLPIVREEEL